MYVCFAVACIISSFTYMHFQISVILFLNFVN